MNAKVVTEAGLVAAVRRLYSRVLHLDGKRRADIKRLADMDGFFAAPAVKIKRSHYEELADRKNYFYLSHPCSGADGVELVLMNKSSNSHGWRSHTHGGVKSHYGISLRKRGWCCALNYRRAQRSYSEAHDDLQPCILKPTTGADPSGTASDNYQGIADYVQKYYMYPVNGGSGVDTSDMDIDSLFFTGPVGASGSGSQETKISKVFGIAARRRSGDAWEYSAITPIRLQKTDVGFLSIGLIR